MESLFLLIPLSIGVVFIALWIFFRMSDAGQFDDMEGPALRILQDDDAGKPAPLATAAATAPEPGGLADAGTTADADAAAQRPRV